LSQRNFVGSSNNRRGIILIIAKTNPIESLEEHTQELIDRYDVLFESYGDKITNPTVWKLLHLAAIYHDAGKAYSHFQYNIKKQLGIEVDPTDFVHIPHNYLSPFYLPLNKLKLSKSYRRILIESIAYHHEREQILDSEQLKKIAEKDLIHSFERVQKELNVDVPEDNKFFCRIAADLDRGRMKYKEGDEKYFIYVLVKGLLHRLDHAASAHVEIEIDQDYSLSDLTEEYLKKITKKSKGYYLRPLQQFTLENQDKNLILTAQTGMGKTEAALLWAGKKKTFFTVPLRVSLNALYDRVSNDMCYENCGLLHSTSAHHLDEKGMENWEVIYDQSNNFANKLIFTTIDQILKFPFKFRGYEKYYATLAYSCVIIDEIQAYSPWVVAVVIRAIEMIHKIGGKFMITTATLPKIYLDTLKEKDVIDEKTVVKTFFDDSNLRHRIKVEDKTIFEDLDLIVQSGKDKKVLVIVNTVDQANNIYKQIEGKLDNVNVFHARFLQKDRQLIESKLMEFDDNRNEPGVWVTTQIVEASIDIDFDELYTELSPLDSLFQRLGRCYRKREFKLTSENVRIYIKEVSGEGSVYDKDIMQLSKQYLQNHIFENGNKLLESQKMSMVDELYSKETLQGTKFYEEFKKAMNDLEYMEDHIISNTDAQKQLRGDQSVMVIPRSKYDEIIHLFEELEAEREKRKRTQIRRKIELYTCSVRKNSYINHLSSIDYYRQTKNGKYPLMSHLFVLDKDYDFDEKELKGIGIINEDSNIEFA